MDSSSWLRILKASAGDVYAAVREARPRGHGMEMGEFKHLLDSAAQEALVGSLRGSGVSARLVSEEGDAVIGGGGDGVVVADPVDGTTNLSRGLQPATVCLSASQSDAFSGTLAAVVQDLYSGSVYAAEKRHGATLNGEPIKPAAPREARRALISLDISKTPMLERVAPLLREARYLRMLGCSSVDICHVASGVFDAHLDIRGSLRATDVAAALLVLTEAGGSYAADRVTGGDFRLARDSTMELAAASGPVLLAEVLKLTRG